MKKDLTNKNVLITGGSSGIGLALAKELSQNGSKVWILARDLEKLEAASIKINNGNLIKILQADVRDYACLEQIANELRKSHINIDILINSAGVAHPVEFENCDLSIFHQMMDINYFGTVNTVKAFLDLVPKGGHIVNISSMAGVLGIYGYTAYGASKFAVRGFTDSLRNELVLKDIKVSIVYPPDTDTPQLAYENKIKPAITKEIAGTAGVLSAETVAKEIIKGIKKNKDVIIPGLESKAIYSAANLMGNLVFPILNWMARSAEKKVRKNLPPTD